MSNPEPRSGGPMAATVDRVTGKYHEVRLEIYDLHGNCHVTTEIGLIAAIRRAAESAATNYIEWLLEEYRTDGRNPLETWKFVCRNTLSANIERHVRQELGL